MHTISISAGGRAGMPEVEATGVIYLARCKTSGRGYVGQSVAFAQRKKNHLFGCVSCRVFNRAIQKHGKDSFQWIILAEGLQKEELESAEQFYIARYNTVAPNGYNLTSGGECGKEYSAETRTKMSQSQKRRFVNNPISADERKARSEKMKGEGNNFYGKKHTPESLAKIGAASKGRYCSPEARAKISVASKKMWQDPKYRARVSQANKGIKLSPEVRARMSAAAYKRWAARKMSTEAQDRLL